MEFNKNKAELMEERIQQLENELSEMREKLNANIQTVHLDDQQLDDLSQQITESIEWSTNRIVDESKPRTIIVSKNKHDAFSCFIKIALCILFIGFCILGFYTLFRNWSTFYVGGFVNIAAIGTIILVFLACFAIGVDIWCEKDRNYLVALFSALVSLVALIVAFLK